jgi:putative sterol carrier protein
MADTSEFFADYLPNKLKENPDLVSDIDAIFVFDIEDAGKWTVNLTGEGAITEGAADDPGCTVTAKKEDFETMLDNPAQAMMLFMSGKLAVSNVGLAMSLQKLLS